MALLAVDCMNQSPWIAGIKGLPGIRPPTRDFPRSGFAQLDSSLPSFSSLQDDSFLQDYLSLQGY
jgi:hypothetical protein